MGALGSVPLPARAQTKAPVTRRVEPNPILRRGVGLRGLDAGGASPGFTLFTPQTGDGTVYLIDLEGNVVHTWKLPYPPGRYGYLTDDQAKLVIYRALIETRRRFPIRWCS